MAMSTFSDYVVLIMRMGMDDNVLVAARASVDKTLCNDGQMLDCRFHCTKKRTSKFRRPLVAHSRTCSMWCTRLIVMVCMHINAGKLVCGFGHLVQG
jgi:hypothetical protein